MGDKKSTDKGTGGRSADAAGQQKVHRVLNPDGSEYMNPTTGQPGMTQSEWKGRDKSLGLTRPDEAEAGTGGTDAGDSDTPVDQTDPQGGSGDDAPVDQSGSGGGSGSDSGTGGSSR